MPSIIDSVRFPWATVVPNGLSLFARSTSVWIHWWSPLRSAKASMSSWVTSRHSLGPICSPSRRLQPLDSLDLNRRHGPTLLIAQRL